MDRDLERRQRRHFKDGELIFGRGDAASEMYVLYSGKVHIFREHDGRETSLATLGPDDFFGEMALFDDKPRSASARAIGPVEVRVITAETYALMPCDPVIGKLLGTLAARLRAMDNAFEQLSTESESRRAFITARTTEHHWLT